MNRLFAPAIALMNRLKYPQKFALISLLFVVPLALLGALYLGEINAKIDFTRQELDGDQYLRLLRRLYEQTLQDALLARDFANGDAAARADLAASQVAIEAGIQNLRAADARLGQRYGTADRLADLAKDWATLKARTSTMRARTSDDLHDQMIARIRALTSLVGDNSSLILDPDLDSYYMIDATLLKLPELQNLLAQQRALGERVLTQQSASPEDRAALITLSGLIQSNLDATQRDLAVAYQRTSALNLQSSLEGRLDTYLGAVSNLQNMTRQELTSARALNMQPDAYRAVAGSAIRTSFIFWDGAIDKVDELLQARIDGLDQQKNLTIGVTLGILVLVLFVWVAFYLAVMQTVRRLAYASQRMTNGDFSGQVAIDTRDELGDVVRSFNSVAAALVAASAQRQAVLDNAVDGIITIEEDGRIASFNPAAERIFGLPAGQAIGLPIERILPAPDDQQYQMVGVGREVQACRTDGTRFPLDLAVGEMRLGEQHRYIAVAHDLTERKRAAEERAQMQEQIINAQAAALAELSTPLIPISDDVVAMPLIGALDDGRMQQVLDALLQGVEQRRARAAILDITGVPIVDTQVANGLIRAAQAVRLLGARVILTGIRPEVAQTLVGLGVNLSDLVTRSTLQSGIAYAIDGQRKTNQHPH